MPSFPVMGIRIKTSSVYVQLKLRSHLLPTNPTWTTYISQWRETVNTKTTLGHAAQASYISRKLYIWSLVACQSYRNLGLWWSESNQRWFLSLWKRGCMHHFVVLRTVKDKGGSAIISVVSATEIATIQDSSLPPQRPWSTLALLSALSTCWHLITCHLLIPHHSVYGSFYHHHLSSPPPQKKDASVVKKYSYIPDSTTLDVVLTHPRHSIWQTSNRTVMLWESCESRVPEIWYLQSYRPYSKLF